MSFLGLIDKSSAALATRLRQAKRWHWRAAAIAFAAVVTISSLAQAQQVVYSGVIDESQEVPPTGSPATGRAVFVIDRAANTLHYFIRISGLVGTETLAHIHGFSAPGVSSGILYSLPLGSPKIGVITYLESEESGILSGLTYVNIHSSVHGTGEIRGQMYPDNGATTAFSGPIDEAQETPPTGSPATGLGTFAIDTVGNTLDFYITHAGLVGTETLAHIHGFAPPGTPAGILFSLPLGSPKTGTWTYMEAEEAGILAGLAYVNIHTSVHGTGEIRGQILAVSNTITYCTGKTNSLGCVPMISSSGSASVTSTNTFLITATDLVPSEFGQILYSKSGKSNLNFHGGKLCVKAPFERLLPPKGAVNSGTPPCTGVLSRDFNKRIQSGADPALTIGAQVNAQWLQRDPSDPGGFGDTLTNGLQFVIGS